MEVIFKHTEGKPPFIGILFDSELEALENSHFVDDTDEVDFTILTESMGGNLGIRLVCEKKNYFKMYQQLKYDHNEYKRWRIYSHLPLKFGHCIIKDGVLTVVRTPKGKLFVVKVSQFLQA